MAGVPVDYFQNSDRGDEVLAREKETGGRVASLRAHNSALSFLFLFLENYWDD